MPSWDRTSRLRGRAEARPIAEIWSKTDSSPERQVADSCRTGNPTWRWLRDRTSVSYAYCPYHCKGAPTGLSLRAANTLVERFDTVSFSDFSAKWANLGGLGLFCIDAKLCKKILAGKLLTRSNRSTSVRSCQQIFSQCSKWNRYFSNFRADSCWKLTEFFTLFFRATWCPENSVKCRTIWGKKSETRIRFEFDKS